MYWGMDEDGLVRKVLLNCVQPTKESLYGDIPDLDVEKAIEIAKDREKWKKIRPPQRCIPLYGDIANKEEEENVHFGFHRKLFSSLLVDRNGNS